MISILLPSRKRPKELARMAASVYRTATNPKNVEIVVRFDEDDEESLLSAREDHLVCIVGPRIRRMTVYWNECYEVAAGDIVCQGNDDFVMNTQGWDVMVESAFAEVEDRILMVHGNDCGGHFGRFGPHPFVHRKWVDQIGYFIPPYFSSDNGDAWINDVANHLGRRRYIPFEMEHLHPAYGKGPVDITHQERMTRHQEDNPDQLYWDLLPKRMEDVEKLRLLMFSDPDTRKWVPSGGDPMRSMGRCRNKECGKWCSVLVSGIIHCNACGHEWIRTDETERMAR